MEEPSIPGTSITSVKKRKAKGGEGRKGIDSEAIGYGYLDPCGDNSWKRAEEGSVSGLSSVSLVFSQPGRLSE